jgi:TatD DNase family protein
VGEIGLDGHWVPESLWETQEAVFRSLVGIALEGNKPIVVHSRKREKRALEVVCELGARRVLWHCFGGKLALAHQIASLGYYLSIPSHVRRAENFGRMLKGLPRDKILFETDCPYLGPIRDQDSEPADVVQTAAFAAELWKVSVAEVQKRITENFIGLFGVEP